MLRALLQRDRLVVLSGLLAVVLLAWGWLLTGAGLGMDHMDMGGGPAMAMAMAPEWSIGYAALIFSMWAIMMMAMMLPAAAPAILLADALMRRGEGSRFGSTGLFVLGYLAIWSSFSLVATALQWTLDWAGLLSEHMASGSAIFAGLLLIAAGAYQWTPFRRTCLVQCRSPYAHLVRYWRRGPLLAGARHGLYCLGCCWMLMALLFVGGLMNVLWIAGLAILVSIEKLLPIGPRVGRLTGLALMVWGAIVLAR